jgi:hypothetical protein
MSYEYLLCRAPPGSTGELAFDEIEPVDPIGSIEEIKAAISNLFPAVRWSQHESHLGIAWFGLGGPPEFQFTASEGELVTNIMMSHARPDEVKLVIATLGLVALDLQQESVLSG